MTARFQKMNRINLQSVCQNKHVMKQEEAVREDLPLSLQMEYKKCMRRARNEQSEFWSKTTYVPAAGVDHRNL